MVDYKQSYDVLSELFLRKTQLNIVMPFIVSLFIVFILNKLTFYFLLFTEKNTINKKWREFWRTTANSTKHSQLYNNEWSFEKVSTRS